MQAEIAASPGEPLGGASDYIARPLSAAEEGESKPSWRRLVPGERAPSDGYKYSPARIYTDKHCSSGNSACMTMNPRCDLESVTSIRRGHVRGRGEGGRKEGLLEPRETWEAEYVMRGGAGVIICM